MFAAQFFHPEKAWDSSNKSWKVQNRHEFMPLKTVFKPLTTTVKLPLPPVKPSCGTSQRRGDHLVQRRPQQEQETPLCPVLGFNEHHKLCTGAAVGGHYFRLSGKRQIKLGMSHTRLWRSAAHAELLL